MALVFNVQFNMAKPKAQIGATEFTIRYSSNFNDSCVIQCNYPFTWGYEIDFHNRNEEEIKSCNNSVVAVWYNKSLRPFKPGGAKIVSLII